MNIKKYLLNKLNIVFDKLGFDRSLVTVSFSDRADLSHLQCNSAFGIAKKHATNPVNVANKIAEEFKESDEFEVFVSQPAFINFIVKNSFLSKIATDCYACERVGIKKLDNPQKILIDFGGANVAKPLHIGHIRSAIIGESLKRLNKFMGNTVIGDVHLGDWGLQMGLTIAQLMDDFDLGFYFGKDVKKVNITPEILSFAYPKASARKDIDKEFAQRASDITLFLQQKKQGYYQIWEEMRLVSVDMVKGTYDRLGAHFDLWEGESSANSVVGEVVDIFKNKKLAYVSDGALVVDVIDEADNKPLPPAILIKHNGAQMYVITDIATAYDRHNRFAPNKIIYITDNRQTLHFEQVFRCIRRAELVPANLQLTHITFGTINGKDGKPFKTREGKAVGLDDIIDIVEEKAKEKLIENGIDDDTTYKMVGLAALKFGDLSNVIAKDYVFDVDKFVTFEGKTGPYLQYTAVRIKSLLKKAEITQNDFSVCDLTKEIVIAILKFIDAVELSYNENSLHYIALSLYELAAKYSTFYNDVKILTSEAAAKNNYLKISHLVLKTLNLGLDLLGIEAPDKM